MEHSPPAPDFRVPAAIPSRRAESRPPPFRTNDESYIVGMLRSRRTCPVVRLYSEADRQDFTFEQFSMDQKLGIGASFPSMTISLVKGGSIEIPGGLPGRYRIFLFYRGHWCPFCRKALAGFEAVMPELTALGVSVLAASVDPIEKAREVQAEVSFPIGYGVTHEMARQIGAWWDGARAFIQPSEFMLDETDQILFSSYSDGPLARFIGSEVVGMVKRIDSRKNPPQ